MDDAEIVPKPDELLALHDVTAELFDTLRTWFSVPPEITVDLRAVDSAVAELGDPQMIAAFAMRKLQALHLLATPGVRTTTDVVVTMVQDLDRALVQAPNMRLRVAAESTDWDAAFEQLDQGAGSGTADPVEAAGLADRAVPMSPEDEDPETNRFRELHARLHEAKMAVIEACEGRIRHLE